MRISGAHAAIFAVGFFGLGFVPMMTVAVPLWALEIGATPFMIGLVLGARAALSVVLSIPGGALMDRLGINRIAAAAAIRLMPSLSISAPPGMESTTESAARAPSTRPIMNGVAPISSAQSGTATVIMGTKPRPKNPTAKIAA